MLLAPLLALAVASGIAAAQPGSGDAAQKGPRRLQERDDYVSGFAAWVKDNFDIPRSGNFLAVETGVAKNIWCDGWREDVRWYYDTQISGFSFACGAQFWPAPGVLNVAVGGGPNADGSITFS